MGCAGWVPSGDTVRQFTTTILRFLWAVALQGVVKRMTTCLKGAFRKKWWRNSSALVSKYFGRVIRERVWVLAANNLFFFFFFLYCLFVCCLLRVQHILIICVKRCSQFFKLFLSPPHLSLSCRSIWATKSVAFDLWCKTTPVWCIKRWGLTFLPLPAGSFFSTLCVVFNGHLFTTHGVW